jgi:hypothetical protein
VEANVSVNLDLTSNPGTSVLKTDEKALVDMLAAIDSIRVSIVIYELIQRSSIGRFPGGRRVFLFLFSSSTKDVFCRFRIGSPIDFVDAIMIMYEEHVTRISPKSFQISESAKVDSDQEKLERFSWRQK